MRLGFLELCETDLVCEILSALHCFSVCCASGLLEGSRGKAENNESGAGAVKWFDPRLFSLAPAKAGCGIQAAAATAFVGVLCTAAARSAAALKGLYGPEFGFWSAAAHFRVTALAFDFRTAAAFDRAIAIVVELWCSSLARL